MRFLHHFCTGYLLVRLSGLSPERFFNLCSAAGLEIWDIVFDKGTYQFHIGIGDFYSCRPFVKKAKVRLKILKKFGLPFFLYKNKRRKWWGIGVVSFFACLYLLSLFVWDIEYQGNLTYTDDMLGHYLESLDIRRGIRKRNVSCEDLEASLRNQFNGITWVSARVSGTRLYIHIKENEVPLEIPVKDESPCDLIAAYDGVITSLIVRSGIALVRPGDTVEKGQILVSGRVPITNDSGEATAERQVHSDADITARIVRTETRELSLWHKCEIPTGRVRKGLMVSVFEHSFVWLFPNFRKTEWKTVMEEETLCLFGDFYLPLQYGLISSFEVAPYDKKYTEMELLEIAEEYKNEITENLIEKGVQIIENNVKILVNGSVCRLEASLITEESIKEEAAIQEEITDMSEEQGE